MKKNKYLTTYSNNWIQVPVNQYKKLRNVEENVMNLSAIAVNRYEILSNLKETTDSNMMEINKLRYNARRNQLHVVPNGSISTETYSSSTKDSKKKCKDKEIVVGKRIEQTLYTIPVIVNRLIPKGDNKEMSAKLNVNTNDGVNT